jgi:two-component system response regulator (stage 0 sporulation protein A)
MKNILVVEDNEKFINIIKAYFEGNKMINIKYISSNGLDGFNKYSENFDDIDLVLLDLVMPNKDGLYFLDEMVKNSLYKDVILMTSFSSDNILKKMSSYGVNYFMLKPFTMEDLENKIISLFEDKNEKKYNNSTLKIRLTKLLHELGVPSHIKGYDYIRDSVILLYKDPKIIGGITKELYPEIADRYDTSVRFQRNNDRIQDKFF